MGVMKMFSERMKKTKSRQSRAFWYVAVLDFDFSAEQQRGSCFSSQHVITVLELQRGNEAVPPFPQQTPECCSWFGLCSSSYQLPQWSRWLSGSGSTVGNCCLLFFLKGRGSPCPPLQPPSSSLGHCCTQLQGTGHDQPHPAKPPSEAGRRSQHRVNPAGWSLALHMCWADHIWLLWFVHSFMVPEPDSNIMFYCEL